MAEQARNKIVQPLLGLRLAACFSISCTTALPTDGRVGEASPTRDVLGGGDAEAECDRAGW